MVYETVGGFLVEVVVYRAGECGKYNVYIRSQVAQYDEDLEALVAQGVCGPSSIHQIMDTL